MSIASIRIALLCSAFVAVASGVRAQGLADGMYGRPVAAVRFEIEGRPDTSPTLLALVDVAVGQALSQEDVRSSMERLYVAGRFESVAVVGVPGPGGVEVTFRLVPRHVVNRLTVTGTTGIGAGTLHSRLLQHYGGVPANQRTADVEQTVIQMLNDEGYLGPVVNSSVVPTHDPEGATLVLDVVAGEQTRIASVDVEGTTLVSAEQVIRRVGASVGQPFKRREIESAISAFEDDLRTRGYYEADVSLEADPAADAVHARVVVTTGPIVELRVEPADALPGDLETLIPIRRQRSADVDLLEDSKDTIVRLLKRDGYAAASVNFTRMMSDDETRLLVTFSISRGPRHFVDRIDVTDGLVVPAVTLRALLDIQPGEVFDESRFLQGLGRVVEEYLRRGYYQVEALPDRETVANRGGSDEAFVVLHPNISEGPRGDIRAVDFQFIDSHAMSESDLRAVTQSSAGEPYVEAVAAADRAALRSFYLEHGFLNVAVDVQPEFADAGRSVSLAVRINEGPQIRIAEITVVGNEHVSENLIREELGLSVGAPLSGTALLDSQQHLYDMGVFRRVSVAPADRIGSEVDARIIVSVVEAPATTVGVGGGLEGRRRHLSGGRRRNGTARVRAAWLLRDRTPEHWRPQPVSRILLAPEPSHLQQRRRGRRFHRIPNGTDLSRAPSLQDEHRGARFGRLGTVAAVVVQFHTPIRERRVVSPCHGPRRDHRQVPARLHALVRCSGRHPTRGSPHHRPLVPPGSPIERRRRRSLGSP